MKLKDLTPREEKLLQAAHDYADSLTLLYGKPEERTAAAALRMITMREKLLETAVQLLIEKPPVPSGPARKARRFERRAES